MVSGDAAVRVNQCRPTEAGIGAGSVRFGSGGSRRSRRRGDIVELEVLRLEWGSAPCAVGGGHGVQRYDDAVSQEVAASDACAPEPVVAPVGINGGIGGDVPGVVGPAGFYAEEVGAVLCDVYVERALLRVIPVKGSEGEDHVVEIG